MAEVLYVPGTPSRNLPPGPYLVVKTYSGKSKADAIEHADDLATAMLRRPIEQLHRDVVRVDALKDDRSAPWRYDVEVHYRVQP
ncbi:MAG TPA: hypothetical protein VIM47_00810 [Dermatophilaceae bacterium]